MSWYDNFKTVTKDYLTKGKSYASSFWYDDYDTSYDVLETYGGFKKQDLEANLADEMADVLWVLICMANQTGINLTEAFEKNMLQVFENDLNTHAH